MKKNIFLLVLILASLMFFSSCAAGPNNQVKIKDGEGKMAGFFSGLWHGCIALFTFIISLFSDKVNIYEVHNNGGWYNFGFILGVMIFFSGSGGAGNKAVCKKK